ncbi:hypothetical protein ABK040_014897 [Willaertia magna]
MGRKLPEQNFIQFNNIEKVTNYIAYPTGNSHVAEFKIDFDFKYHTLEKKLLIARKQVTINKLYKIGQESDFSDYKQLKITTAAYYPTVGQVYISKCAVLSLKYSDILKTKCTVEDLKMDKIKNIFETSPLYNANTSILEMELENNQYLYLVSVQCYHFCCNLQCKKNNNYQLLVKSELLLKEEQDLNNVNKRKREGSNSNDYKEAKMM